MTSKIGLGMVAAVALALGASSAQVGAHTPLNTQPSQFPAASGKSQAKSERKAKPVAKPASTPESRSAAVLALSAELGIRRGHRSAHQRDTVVVLRHSGARRLAASPADAKLAPGATGPDVALLRRRLVISDDMPPEQEAGDVYDQSVGAGVRRFQMRHGLEGTGSVDARSLRALNVPVAHRLKQLEASLERLLGMDFVFAGRYVVVEFLPLSSKRSVTTRLSGRYPVIVGKVDKPSPTLTAYITAINPDPTSTVPLSITKNEIFTRMRRDPTYISRMHMRVLGARDEELDLGSIDWSSERSPNFTVRPDPRP